MIRLSRKSERWAIGVLGVVCLGLGVSLFWQVLKSALPNMSSAQPAASRDSRKGSNPPAAARAKPGDDLERYNPELDLALLKQIETQSLPKAERNPFEYPPPPAPKVAETAAKEPPPPPKPPPPPPIKAIGYSVKAGNVAEALVADEQDIYVVHVGDTFANRYHVLAISPDRIDIQDATTQQTVHLPIAQ
jgi:hypothetical protein